MLDERGELYYRRFVNEINLLGRNWQKFQLEKKENNMNRILDFDVGPKDIITINANGKIKLLFDINRPRLYDV